MSENISRIEQHGCIVCGKLYDLLTVRTPVGALVGVTVTNPGAHPITETDPPLLVCNMHSSRQVEIALARHHPGPEKQENPEDEE